MRRAWSNRTRRPDTQCMLAAALARKEVYPFLAAIAGASAM